jgi:hypothetical protein
MKQILIFSSILLVSVLSLAQPVRLFESDTIFRCPESIAFDPVREVLYVSNYTAPTRQGSWYGTHTVSKIDLKGNILADEWITGLSSPTGICIRDDKLFIVDRFGVVEYDLKEDRISNKYYIRTTEFLNDITVDPEGTIYVTASGTSKVYRISHGQVDVWLEHDSINNPNGILWDEGILLIGTTSDGCIKKIDPETKEITKIAYLGETVVDGIRPCGSGYLASIFEGNLFWLNLQGEVREILNTREEGLFLADFEYIESRGLICIPALWNKKILICQWYPDGD